MLFFGKKKTLEEALKPISSYAIDTLPFAIEMKIVQNDKAKNDAWNRISVALKNEERTKNRGYVEIKSEIYRAIPYNELISTLGFMGYSVSCCGCKFAHNDYDNGYTLRITW